MNFQPVPVIFFPVRGRAAGGGRRALAGQGASVRVPGTAAGGTLPRPPFGWLGRTGMAIVTMA